FVWLTWLQQSNFGTFDFDMGVFDQEIWLAAHHLNPFVTIRGLNMWANHVNPIVYLLVPFYWLGAGPHFLFLLQTVALAATAIPLWLLARDRLGRPWLALGVPAAWLLYPAVEWMTWWPFQPEYLAVPALAFAYYFADRRRWWWYGVCVALVLMTKEDAVFPVLALGVILAWRHRRRAGLITIGAAAAWFVICLEAIMPAATPSAGPFFLYQYGQLGTGVWSIIGNAIRRPSLVFGPIFSWDRVHYYLQLLAPAAFLCALAPVTLLIAVPTLVVNMVNNQGYTYNIQFQYSAFLAVGVFLATVEGLARWRGHRLRWAQAALVLALVGAAIAGNVLWSPSPLDSRQYAAGVWSRESDAHVAEMAKLVGMVPATASVSASYSIVPHLAHRDRIFTWPNPWIRSYFGISNTVPPLHPRIVNYIVLDTSTDSSQTTALLQRLTKPGGPFKVIVDVDDALLAVRR
ncbi:MAG TPA: DUF2079 domain-containing protein, partial [Acidimicrobiales bacterium]|nr:DUF2079 domain-containing protein [Acidimicrobiales bacterium]